jgi:hypothetical protein
MNFINFLNKVRPFITTGKANFNDVINLYRKYFKKDPEGMEVIGIRQEFSKAGEGKKVLDFPQKRTFKEEIETMESTKPLTEEEIVAKYKKMNEQAVSNLQAKKEGILATKQIDLDPKRKQALRDEYVEKLIEMENKTGKPYAEDQYSFSQFLKDKGLPSDMDYATGGRVGYQVGGPATPEQYATALAKVGGGTEADKRRSLGSYLGDYIATQGQKLGNTAIIPLQAAKGVLGISGTPTTSSMESALQNIIQNQIKNTGQLSGNINYKDYGVKTSTGAEFEGFGNRSITDPEAALATTLGRASYTVDPTTGKVNFTGGTAYDFRDDQFGGLGRFISKGGLFNSIPNQAGMIAPLVQAYNRSQGDNIGATEYKPEISLDPRSLKPSQQLSDYEKYVMGTEGVPLNEAQFNAGNQLAPDGNIAAAGFTSDLEYQKARDALADQLTVGGQTSPLSKQSIYENILKDIGRTYNDPNFGSQNLYSNPLYITGDLSETPQQDIKQRLDDIFLQGNNLGESEGGVYGTGNPFRRYVTPEAQKTWNITGNPLRLSSIYGGYGLNEQLNQLQNVYGKSFVDPYRNQLQDTFIDYYKNKFTGDPGFVQNIFGLSNAPTFRYGGSVDNTMGMASLFTRRV